MSDLDPQKVASRVTGHFQPLFPATRPVNRPVFASKVLYTGLYGGLEHLKIETRLIDERFASVMGECVI